MGTGLFTEIKNNPLALALVIAVHLVLIVLLGINLASGEKPPMPLAKKHNIIDAVVVDASKYDDREKKKKLAAQKKIEDKKTAEKKRLQEKEKRKVQERKKAEQKRLAEKKKVQKEKLAAEKKKALALTKKKEADRKKEERQRLAKEKKAKEKKAKEKKARELKEKQRLEAEKKRKQEEDRQRRAEEKAELKRSLIEEERREEEARVQAVRAAKLQTLRQQYMMDVKRAVENSWLRPAATSDEQSCEIVVTQTMMGDVIDVLLQACSSDTAFQRSVERAVRKASPLPLPLDPEIFEKKIEFTFKPR